MRLSGLNPIRLKPIKPAFTFNLIPAVGIVMLLLLIGELSGYAAALVSATHSPWAHFGFLALNRLSQYGVIIGGAIILWTAGLRLWAKLDFSPGADSQPGDLAETHSEAPVESKAIVESVRNMATVLARVEQDRNAATLLMGEAQTQSTMLVSLIKAIARKADDYDRQIETLSNAMTAITGGNPLDVAQAAGKVSDAHIQSLMLTDVHDSDYWLNVNRVIAAQSGSLQRWSAGYRRFAARLLLDFGRLKAQLTTLEAAGDLVDVARPLVTVQTNLNAAGNYLQLKNRPGLEAAEVLPLPEYQL